MYVEEESSSSENDDDDTMKMMIQYPTTCIAVQSFVLKQGANRLKSFQRQHLSTAAYLFCCACGVHLMHALQPDSTDLFVNVRCLKRGTFVTRFADMSVTRKNYEQILRINNLSPGCSSPSNHLMRAWQSDSADLSVNVQLGTFVASLADENAAENNDGKFLKLKNSSASCTSPSDDFLGVPASPERVADDDDPLFTVTAASSLSKSLSDYWDDRSSTAELEFAAYRLRKALSPDTSKVAVSPQNDSDDEGSSKSAGSFAPLGPQNPINLQAPFAAAASGNPEVNNTASTMEIQTTKPKASKVKKRVKDNDKKPSSATASTGTSTSFQDSMAASLQSTEETRQLLRQFMSKHVASLNNPV